MRRCIAFASCFLAVLLAWHLINFALAKVNRSELRIGKYQDRLPSI